MTYKETVDRQVFWTGNNIWLKGECWELRRETNPAIGCEECEQAAFIELLSVFDDGISFLCADCFKKWVGDEEALIYAIIEEIRDESQV